MRILIVEDDELSAKALTTVLCSQHYAVEVASDGQAGWELAETFDYDLILLDVTLPKLDGISLCRRLRSHGLKMPILLLTGRDSSHDKALGLDAGADDYVVKPFEQEELVARVRALLRRGGSTLSQPVLEWGSLQLDPSSHEVTYKTYPIQLTAKEYALLELFLRNPRRVFSCSAILDHIWSFDKTPGEEAVRTQIKGLRHKLKAAGAPVDVIETVYGIGYRLKPIVTNVATAASDNNPSQQQTLAALAMVWNRFKDRISEQVAVIEQAAKAALENIPDQELITKAQREAHTLAGSLGTFGLSEGSKLARKIEHLLQAGIKGTKEVKQLWKLAKALRQEITRSPQGIDSQTVTPKEQRPFVLIIDSDRQLGSELANQAQSQGIRAEIATSLAEAKDRIAQTPPNVVLLDPAVASTTEQGLTLLAQISKQTPPIPVLVFTAQNSLSDRLKVARLGGCTFLQKPVPANQVLEALTHILQRADTCAEAVVMVVDDDPQILATVQTLLEPWGLRVVTLDDSRQFWQKLEATSPDILILDITMPHVNGVELCQVVRNDLRTRGLPVLFLTAHTDVSTVKQAFAVGADDFVSKPINGSELVTRIINRLERLKLLRKVAKNPPTVSNGHRLN